MKKLFLLALTSLFLFSFQCEGDKFLDNPGTPEQTTDLKAENLHGLWAMHASSKDGKTWRKIAKNADVVYFGFKEDGTFEYYEMEIKDSVPVKTNIKTGDWALSGNSVTLSIKQSDDAIIIEVLGFSASSLTLKWKEQGNFNFGKFNKVNVKEPIEEVVEPEIPVADEAITKEQLHGAWGQTESSDNGITWKAKAVNDKLYYFGFKADDTFEFYETEIKDSVPVKTNIKTGNWVLLEKNTVKLTITEPLSKIGQVIIVKVAAFDANNLTIQWTEKGNVSWGKFAK